MIVMVISALYLVNKILLQNNLQHLTHMNVNNIIQG